MKRLSEEEGWEKAPQGCQWGGTCRGQVDQPLRLFWAPHPDKKLNFSALSTRGSLVFSWHTVLNGTLSHPSRWSFPQLRGSRGLCWTAQPHSSLHVPQLCGLDYTLFPSSPSLSPRMTPPARLDKLTLARRCDRCPHNACLATVAIGVPQRQQACS